MTNEEAIRLYDTKWWNYVTTTTAACFQFNEERLCMPFPYFHECLEKTLGRSVSTHEMALDHKNIQKELNSKYPTPSFDDIMSQIPENKRFTLNKETTDANLT